MSGGGVSIGFGGPGKGLGCGCSIIELGMARSIGATARPSAGRDGSPYAVRPLTFWSTETRLEAGMI